MAKYKLVPIEEIKAGDKVLTVDGPRVVEHVHTPDSETQEELTANFYKVSFDNGMSIEVSEIHRFMDSVGGWVYVTELKEGDVLKYKSPTEEGEVRITSVESIGIREKYDLTVEGNQQYVTEHGVVNHNTGTMYSADTVFIIGKSKETNKENEIAGYNFTLRVEKSRFIKEGSKIGIQVLYESGIQKYSGLLDIAKAVGLVENCRVGRSGGIKLVLTDDEKTSLGITEDITCLTSEVGSNETFWNSVFKYTNLKEIVESLYKLPTNMQANELELAESVMNDDLATVILGD